MAFSTLQCAVRLYGAFPANPDISGVGVRIAILTPKTCFPLRPLLLIYGMAEYLDDELTGVKTNLGISLSLFAILVSTIIQATVKTSGQMITSFHAGVILD